MIPLLVRYRDAIGLALLVLGLLVAVLTRCVQ